MNTLAGTIFKNGGDLESSGLGSQWVGVRAQAAEDPPSPLSLASVKGEALSVFGEHIPLHFFFCPPEARMRRLPLSRLKENISVYKLSLYN